MASTVVKLICRLIVVTNGILLTNIMSMLRVIFCYFLGYFWAWPKIDHHWFRLHPGGFSFQSMNVLSINFVRYSEITCGHRTVQDEIIGNDIFEVSRQRVSDLHIKVASLFSVLYLALALSFFILVHRLNQCDLTISRIVIMQAILVHLQNAAVDLACARWKRHPLSCCKSLDISVWRFSNKGCWWWRVHQTIRRRNSLDIRFCSW